MTQQTSLDPFAMWKSFYDKAESNWSELINESMQKEAFSEWMGHSLNLYLQYQDLVQKSTENYLKQVNMPTRAEVSNLASLMINLEEKIDQLDQKVEDELIDKQVSTDINKLKNEFAKLDKKLDKILKMLQQNEGAENTVAAAAAPSAETDKKQA